jgi:hypothetical protein
VTEAPEKIWAGNDGYANRWDRDTPNGWTEYTRSDIAKADWYMRAEIKRLEQVVSSLEVHIMQMEDNLYKLEAEVARLRESLGEFARFASKDGLGASVPFGQSKLHKARAALEYKD